MAPSQAPPAAPATAPSSVGGHLTSLQPLYALGNIAILAKESEREKYSQNQEGFGEGLRNSDPEGLLFYIFTKQEERWQYVLLTTSLDK